MIVNPVASPVSLRNAIPALTVLAAVVIDALPLPHSGPTAVAPLITLGTIFFWLVHRPRLMNPALIFMATILLDSWSNLPLGMTALSILLARAMLLPKDRFLASSPFVVVWACFGLAAGLTLVLRWVIASLWWGRLMPASPSLFEWLLTLLLYPLIGHMLVMTMPFLPRLKHASGR